MKKINNQKLWFFGMAVGALLLALPLAADEDKSEAAERSPQDIAQRIEKGLSKQLGKILKKAREFWIDESEAAPEGKRFGLDLDLSDPRMADLMQFYQAQLERRRPSRNEKDHRSVLAEYKPIIASVRENTARILNGDGKQVALATVVSPDGFLVTKASELPSNGLICEFSDGRKISAQVMDTQRRWDIALIKVKAGDLKPISFVESKSIELGTFLVASGIGEYPIAVGVASVAPRNLSMADRGFLGVGMENTEDGVRVNQVQRGSGAAEAGIKIGDVILKIDDKSIDSPAQLAKAVSGLKPKETISIRFRRGEEEKEVTAVLGSRGTGGPRNQLPDRGSQLGGPLSENRGNFPNALQHDLTLRPDECGGPLVNLDGRAVGVNIARGGRVKSFAIPAADLKEILGDLKLGKFKVKELEALEQELDAIDKEIAEIERQLRRAQERREEANSAVEKTKD